MNLYSQSQLRSALASFCQLNWFAIVCFDDGGFADACEAD